MFELLNLLVRKITLTFLQFQNPAILERERQLMAESLPSANDGFPRLFAFFVELINMLHRPPVGYVTLFSLPEEAVQHTAAGQQSNVALVQWRYRPAAHLLLFTDEHSASVLHCDRAFNGILYHVLRQACAVDRRGTIRRNNVAFPNTWMEASDRIQPVSGPHQHIRSSRFTPRMWFLTRTEDHGLVEANTIRMAETEHAEPVKLAGQQARTRIKSRRRNHEYQHPISANPAIAVVEEYEFHSLIAVRSEFRVVWRVEVQKRTAFRLDLALKCATVDGCDSPLDASCDTIRVNFNGGKMIARTPCDLQEGGTVAGAWIYGCIEIGKNE